MNEISDEEREHCLNAVRDSSGITIREQVEMLIRERAMAHEQGRDEAVDHDQCAAEANAQQVKLESLQAKLAAIEALCRKNDEACAYWNERARDLSVGVHTLSADLIQQLCNAEARGELVEKIRKILGGGT